MKIDDKNDQIIAKSVSLQWNSKKPVPQLCFIAYFEMVNINKRNGHLFVKKINPLKLKQNNVRHLFLSILIHLCFH